VAAPKKSSSSIDKHEIVGTGVAGLGRWTKVLTGHEETVELVRLEDGDGDGDDEVPANDVGEGEGDTTTVITEVVVETAIKLDELEMGTEDEPTDGELDATTELIWDVVSETDGGLLDEEALLGAIVKVVLLIVVVRVQELEEGTIPCISAGILR
jgi:hypothetical protein